MTAFACILCFWITIKDRILLNHQSDGMINSGYGPRTAGANTADGAWDYGHIHYFMHRDFSEMLSSAGFRVHASEALVDISKETPFRLALDRWRRSRLVREFLSGNLVVDK